MCLSNRATVGHTSECWGGGEVRGPELLEPDDIVVDVDGAEDVTRVITVEKLLHLEQRTQHRLTASAQQRLARAEKRGEIAEPRSRGGCVDMDEADGHWKGQTVNNKR